jgi:hypothetical protein
LALSEHGDNYEIALQPNNFAETKRMAIGGTKLHQVAYAHALQRDFNHGTDGLDHPTGCNFGS